VDNPGRYRTLYLSDAPVGAVAEAFGTLRLWTEAMFGRPDLPDSRRALVEYETSQDLQIFDLDDARALDSLGLRPSQVVTRDRKLTQRWALTIYEQGRWGGVRWWSYYDPRWYSHAVWEVTALTVRTASIRPLFIDDPAVVEASEVLGRPRG
jgi:hypothetical protein